MNKVEKVFTLIYNDSKLKEELIKKQTIDEMYEYCTSISDGYTKEEFEKFVNEMCQYVEEELTNKNLSISDEDMKKVSGGTQLKNKAISSLLAAMAISTPLVGAASNNQENTDIPVESKTSITQKIKNFVSKNPIKTKATAAGISVMALLGWGLHNKNVKEEQRKKTLKKELELAELAGQRMRVREEARRAQEEAQVAQNRQAADQITHTMVDILNQIVELSANLRVSLDDLPRNNVDLTEQNVTNAETALRLLGERLSVATDEMNINQEFINKIAIPEIKDGAQNAWNDINERITRINTDYNNASTKVTAKRNALNQIQANRNFRLNRPRGI